MRSVKFKKLYYYIIKHIYVYIHCLYISTSKL